MPVAMEIIKGTSKKKIGRERSLLVVTLPKNIPRIIKGANINKLPSNTLFINLGKNNVKISRRFAYGIVVE